MIDKFTLQLILISEPMGVFVKEYTPEPYFYWTKVVIKLQRGCKKTYSPNIMEWDPKKTFGCEKSIM